MDYEEAMDVLRSWHGQSVIVVAFVEPGVSLHPFRGDLEIEEPGHGMVRGAVAGDDGQPPTRIAFPSGTFHEGVLGCRAARIGV